MERASFGIRVHSGWGALAAVSGKPAAFEVIDRRRIVITDPLVEGANQPYHFAKELKLPAAEEYLDACAAISERLAVLALLEALEELRGRGYRVERCAILLASGRPLPLLPKILASHSLIHTAEGEFFRRAFWTAGELLGIQVTGIREQDLEDSLIPPRPPGPPWTTDQKTACAAAALASQPASER